MSVRKEMLLIVVLLAIIVVLVSISSFFKLDVEESDAKRFVQEDLEQKYPQDETEILTIFEKKDETGQNYFELKVRITKNAESTCPQRKHTYYYYPKQNFVNPPDEVITSGCEICTGTNRACIIIFPEEAIIASHTFAGTEEVAELIGQQSVTHTVLETANTWVVEWKDTSGKVLYTVTVAKNGNILSVKAS